MTKFIINDITDLETYFSSPPKKTFGRKSSGFLPDDFSHHRQSTGCSAIQRAAERINEIGAPLRVDQVMSVENWDLVITY